MVRPILRSSSTETRIVQSGSWLSNGGGEGDIAPAAAISGTQEI